MRLHFQSIGHGEPLVILHGLFGSADNWRSIAKALSSERQVISVDLRNHGRSFHHSQQTFDLMAEDLLNLLDHLGLSVIDLLGHSLGGKTAMQFSQNFTDRLRKLIIVDIAPRQYADEHSQIFKALLAQDLSKFSTRSQVSDALAEALPDPQVRQFLLLNLQKGDNGLSWRINLQGLFCNYPGLLQSVSPENSIELPALFLSGSKSDYVTDDDWLQIKSLYPQAEYVVIDGAGHWVHAEKPDAFIQQVNRFLADD
ncbi:MULTISPECIES: alpha/beta fold hydrolase [unclassified Methylophaga]|jgi:pimeloyl-ACP methyl ester carboxylesterase|uniref:alpha/beta fold hydrolase n=1 Tax=unclassified Methylophaga TaxID=2629249 RepID=UPI000C958BB6|nr:MULTISPECIES: alpha/beta fold hydrolase [unclassified Methylophaga]MAK67061.1 alpha/beta hydrolase [Methylophaga sp.]MAY18099.1 alpha/beta hydrolase [Methylophaga sp.]HAO25250.1 alpha/beta hydrolase [Methylophaga sp.]HCD04435.1 alpha/beta hydrolase [Methylophaga sp.]|tara:strand:+ start:8405 stop:9169 length:765 start_codon:yes stop_codon:yes gene_type:complete